MKEINPNLETIPAEEFTFQLVGAKMDERDPKKIQVSAFIASDGPFQGRKVFFSYPDPDKQPWAPRVLKRLEQSLGVDSNEGEHPIEYLNRATGNRFISNMQHRSYTPEGGSEVTKSEVNIFNVRPSA